MEVAKALDGRYFNLDSKQVRPAYPSIVTDKKIMYPASNIRHAINIFVVVLI
jgi:hypothetical protein